MTDLESRLREVLGERARQAPPGPPLAERILAEVDAPVLRPRRGWRTWTFPLLAAAAVAAVIATVLGLSRVHFSSAPEPAGTHSVTPSSSTTSSSTTSSAPTSPSPTTPGAAIPVTPIPGLSHFQLIDTTYFGTDRSWALGSADCSSTDLRPCAALANTTDGGRSWQRIGLPNGLTIPLQTCAAACVRGIRFATPEVGYLFGPSTLLITADGGASWLPAAGGALAIETLDNTVIRVALHDPSCLGTCRLDLFTAAIGSDVWKPSGLPFVTGTSVQLARVAGSSYLLVRQGMSPAAVSGVIYRSTDGGGTWTRVGPKYAGLRSAAVADGRLYLVSSTSSGTRLFRYGSATPISLPPGVTDTSASAQLTAVDAKTLLLVVDRLYRSTDSGQTWHVVLDHAPNSDLGPPAFEDPEVGHWATDGGRVLWSTSDGGATWTETVFSR
jgi:photosystem II stability/assembly factor-like uncharacterized protein